MVNKSEAVVKKRMVIDITRMTVHNGPGIRTVILFKGCPLRCVWCSTPESQRESPEIAFYPDRCIRCDDCMPICPSGAIHLTGDSLHLDRSLCNSCGNCAGVCYTEALKLLGQEMTVRELVEEVKKDVIIYKHSHGGVTVSGGEPLSNKEFTLELLRSIREEGISIGIDTCGYVPWENIEPVLPYTDFFLWDLKIMDEEKHREYTGVSNRRILENMRLVAERGVPVYIRVPVVPDYNDSEDNIRATCEFARKIPSLVEINLLPLHHLGKARYTSLDREYPIDGIPLIPDGVLQKMKLLVESCGLKCKIIG